MDFSYITTLWYFAVQYWGQFQSQQHVEVDNRCKNSKVHKDQGASMIRLLVVLVV